MSLSCVFRSSVLSATASFLIASLRLLPMWAARRLVSNSLGASWSDTAVQATCTHLRQVMSCFSPQLHLLYKFKNKNHYNKFLFFSSPTLQYHTMRNVLYMAMTEFREVPFFFDNVSLWSLESPKYEFKVYNKLKQG